ncbi:esterase/lipase family protein [Kitasatospora sp. NPDC058032]|uniref:esterase/lipase family protein n=1 Tax=Kitasatospora sp. NPDC058032 TaxID=3346307 RepID=UPI0036DF9069
MSTPSAGLPIIYVRGYAGGTPGIEKAVTDPFYGFNQGSTHIRVGRQDNPVLYQFESPLLRLHLDDGYHIVVEGGPRPQKEEDPPPESIWIHRFYDLCSGSWGGRAQSFDLETAARDLLRLIDHVRERTGARRVNLVAHSMGGLICRCLLQKIIPAERNERATDYVAKLFTYGTPHGGITFAVGFGVPEALRDLFDINGADIFGPDRMYQYLTPAPDPDGPPDGWRAVDIGDDDGSGPAANAAGRFPLDRVFCMVGTDARDYDVGHGISSEAVGPRSDGLVQIENAQVTGANRAFAYRSHSGAYGLVNSEEGYQNLRRFLFGDVRADTDLVDVRLPGDPEVTWQAEVRVTARGLPVLMHERAAPHWCPIQLSDPTEASLRARAATAGDGAVPLATTFLSSRLRPQDSGALRFVLDLNLLSLRETHGLFGFGDHLEQTADFSDTLIVDVAADGERPAAWAHWNSEVPGAIRDLSPTGDPLPDEAPQGDGSWLTHVPLPATTRPILGPDARIRLTVGPWN